MERESDGYSFTSPYNQTVIFFLVTRCHIKYIEHSVQYYYYRCFMIITDQFKEQNPHFISVVLNPGISWRSTDQLILCFQHTSNTVILHSLLSHNIYNSARHVWNFDLLKHRTKESVLCVLSSPGFCSLCYF